MNTSEKIIAILKHRNIKFYGAIFFDNTEDDTKITIYDMDYETFNKKIVGWYLVPFDNFVKA